MSKPDIEAIRQSPRQYCTVEDVETLSDYTMALEERVEIIEQQLAEAYEAGRLEQATQIEMMRQAIQALENDSEECLDFDECTSMLVPIDTFHALIDAMVLSPDQALEQFAAKVRNQCDFECYKSNEYGFHRTYLDISNGIRAIKELP